MKRRPLTTRKELAGTFGLTPKIIEHNELTFGLVPIRVNSRLVFYDKVQAEHSVANVLYPSGASPRQ